ncbi:MAG: GNAT family N-acetyltransferase [Rhodospirillales bacterium]|nr:GNAT family N-acetyltransferase [Rhodospirillales bacterium]
MAMQVEHLEFETGVLGAPVARLISGNGGNSSKPNAWLISCRVPSEDANRIQRHKADGFREIESLVTFRRPITAIPGRATPQLAIEADFEACLEIGKTSFQFDRFHSDPGVPNALADKLKQTWVENSLKGRADAVFVTRDGDRATGFNLCRIDGREVTIDLIAVANDMKGRGLGKQLIEQALNHYAGKADYIRAGTQTNNAVSNRLYLGTGFSEFSQQKTLHWINPANGPATGLTIGTAIFSRMDSNRLPGKALTDIAGRPMLGRVIDQLRKCDPLIIATSSRALDAPIVNFAKNEGVAIFRGSDTDVLGRAADCARHFGLGALVRISGDSPFIDAALIEQMVEEHRSIVPDITTNVFPRTLPPGMSVEVISTSVLHRLLGMTNDLDDHEHVTKYIYGNPEKFHIHPVTFNKESYDKIHLAVDTQHDLDRAIWIAENTTEVSLGRVTELARKWDKRQDT